MDGGVAAAEDEDARRGHAAHPNRPYADAEGSGDRGIGAYPI
jgi:hypothetical protein